VVFDRRAGQRDPEVGLQRACRLGLARVGIFDVLRLVEHDAGPADFTQIGVVAVEQMVTGEHDVHALCLARKRIAVPALCAVMKPHAQVGREALALSQPVAEDRHRGGQQNRAAFAARFLVQQKGQRLDRLAEAHVIRQARAEAPSTQECQPA